MKKSAFINILKKRIEQNSLKKLNKLKAKHSKVLHLKHNFIMMKKYLTGNKNKMSVEEAQLIFKLRSRVTETKRNFQGMYDTHECIACGQNEETQEHVIECKNLLKLNMEVTNIPKYDKLFEGTVKEQLEIARLFNQNMSIRETMLDT